MTLSEEEQQALSRALAWIHYRDQGNVVYETSEAVDACILARALSRESARADSWKRSIEGLTPLGSEFVDDPERCAEFIRDRMSSPSKYMEIKKENEVLLARTDRLEAALRGIAKQKLMREMEDQEREDADYECGYESCVKDARAALEIAAHRGGEWIVELEPGVWTCDVQGDPGRTLVVESAKRYESVEAAMRGVDAARKYRPFVNARVVEA